MRWNKDETDTNANNGFGNQDKTDRYTHTAEVVGAHANDAPSDGKVKDAVWGDVGEDGPNYRSLGWVRASVLEVKTQIGLGVLGLVSLCSKTWVLSPV